MDRRGKSAHQRAEEVQAQLLQLTQELERLLVEIEQIMGPPAGPRLDDQEVGEEVGNIAVRAG